MVLLLIVLLFSLPKEEPPVPEEITEEEMAIEKELREIERLREEEVVPLAEEVIQR